jgi:hypothetical protein
MRECERMRYARMVCGIKKWNVGARGGCASDRGKKAEQTGGLFSELGSIKQRGCRGIDGEAGHDTTLTREEARGLTGKGYVWIKRVWRCSERARGRVATSDKRRKIGGLSDEMG